MLLALEQALTIDPRCSRQLCVCALPYPPRDHKPIISLQIYRQRVVVEHCEHLDEDLGTPLFMIVSYLTIVFPCDFMHLGCQWLENE